MVVGEASIHNIIGGMESTGGVRLHNHKRKLKQRFDIIKKLGQGTYGKVQLGINKETGQEVAIKTIKKCKIETEADLIRIRREIQIMSSVQHPNIIHIYEVFENREKMVLVMEYAAGGELYDYLSERKVLSEVEARRIFRQIATAVFYCHKHKICHRDLKLENILLDQVGNAKIADFGLSNVFDEQRLLRTFCGSPLYASPEIVKGTPYHGPEVDCWSLGVLLYTLVYGAMPFDGSNFKRLVKQISQSDYFEPKKPSPASPLLKEMLTVCPARRADIEKICSHWWVNEGYEQNCLEIAEDLAAQTPVRLDLLLSIVPQSASAEKLLVGDQQAGGDVGNNMSSETLGPTRCHSVGSLMELDQNNSDRRIREFYEEEPRTAASGDAKRKLETTPSTDETTAAGIKRKERSRRKERSDEREPRTYSSGSRHHSAPIPISITEEAMEVESMITVPTCKTVDMNKVEAGAACLELIEESKEKSPSRERSKTPVVTECRQLPKGISSENITSNYSTCEQGKADELSSNLTESTNICDDLQQSSGNKSNLNIVTNEAGTDVSNKTNVCFESNITRTTSQEINKAEFAIKDDKKLKEKSLSLDNELINESAETPAKPVERRRSKIFETAEKFNQMATNVENEKPKKIFIPGVNVGGAKRVFERKASLSSLPTTPSISKPNASKVIIDVPVDKKSEKAHEKSKLNKEGIETEDKLNKKDEAKKRAVDIITGAIGKPPVQRKVNGSPPMSPQSQDLKKLGLKIQVAPNDIRNATVSVSTPVDTKFPFDNKPGGQEAMVCSASDVPNIENTQLEEPKMSSKMEITLKSATLPRPRKTSKAEITLAGVKSPEPAAFKTEVEAKIDVFQPQKLRTQRSEVAFPVAAAVSPTNRSSSLEPESRPKTLPKERIIPIEVEIDHRPRQHSATPPPKPPMPQRSMSQRSGSLSRQSTADSDTDSALGSTVGPEPIRKSPREYIIPIAVEGGGYVTPRSGSVEPESKTSTPTSTNVPRPRFTRPRRMSSLLSDASEDESPFSTLQRDSEDLLQRHMHRLRSSRPSRQLSEHADSLSSGEDDDDDGFELLTAENLFSTLLSRVRSLTQRLNVDDNRGSGFPSSRLLGRLSSNSPQAFWGLNKPLSRRLSESQFKHSLSRDADLFSRKDSASSTTPGSPNSPGSHNTPSRDSVFEIGSNTLPRDKIVHEDTEAAEPTHSRKEAQDSIEQNFTPSLARRLSRQFIEQTRTPVPRSPYGSRDKYYQSPTRETNSIDSNDDKWQGNATTSDQTEYRGKSADRNIRRTNSLLESGSKLERPEHPYVRRSISLFDDDDALLPPLPRQVMTLGRKYKDSCKPTPGGGRRENFYSYRTEKIQEEPTDDTLQPCTRNNDNNDNLENGSTSECTSISVCNSNTNIMDTTSSVSAKSYETSSTESTSNMTTYTSDASRNFENRLLAAENLIKESKLKNLTAPKFNPNLCSSYKDTDKCDKESLATMSDTSNLDQVSKRRSCIPSLRLRSGSLTRDSSMSADRRKSFCNSEEALGSRSFTPERSILSKLFRAGSKDDTKDKTQKPKQHRISRFLRPDFFDTPREESKYVKEKEAQKAAENERRKSRFMKRKSESKATDGDATNAVVVLDEKVKKELKNEMNSLKKDKSDGIETLEPVEENCKRDTCENSKSKVERQNSKNSFLHSLEKKLEKYRSSDETSKPVANGTVVSEQKVRTAREKSAPPVECYCAETGSLKKAISVEDLTLKKNTSNNSKSKVSSMLGLFRNTDTKQSTGARSQSTILSKLKKSPPKTVKVDQLTTEDGPSTSKIPTKFARSDAKLVKKLSERKSPDKPATDSKRSPPKENSKDKIISFKEKKTLSEKAAKEAKRKEVDGLDQLETTTTVLDANVTRERKKVDDRKSPIVESEPAQRIPDNKEIEAKAKVDDKKAVKLKKSTTSSKTGNSVIKPEKSDESEKKVKRIVKVKGSTDKTEKDEGDSLKKKKIVRVVRKVVKKASDSSDSKSEDKEKPSRPLIKRISLSKKQEDVQEESNPIVKTKQDTLETKLASSNADTVKNCPSASSSTSAGHVKPTNSNSNILDTNAPRIKDQNDQDSSLNPNTLQSKLTDQRANRANLKLDLSKIPHHAFRNSTPKRDSPKSESAETNPDPQCTNLMDTLSKMTHRASITGNKIIIDKPLRAKDVAELKKEVTECARLIESRAENKHDHHESPVKLESPVSVPLETYSKPLEQEISKSSRSDEKDDSEDTRSDHHAGALSPAEEPESFDSWSICSLDLNHTRGDLHSPTSPSYSLYIGGDQCESVIDRIRRRSFYSRFNDRKRPSLTAPPPGISLPSGSSLSRKLSFDSSKDRDRSKLRGYGSTSSKRHLDRSYDRNDNSFGSYGRSAVGRERYRDILSTSPSSIELRSPVDHYGTLTSSSYDPMRKYLRSPTLDLSESWKKYRTTELAGDGGELTTSLRTPMSSSLSNDLGGVSRSYSSRSSATLPRKYGSSVRSGEPKTIEYYEELLAPSNPEYLATRRSTLSSEYLNKGENGYHNGGSYEVPRRGLEECRSYPERVSSAELLKESDDELEDKIWSRNQRMSEAKESSATSTETQPNSYCTADD